MNKNTHELHSGTGFSVHDRDIGRVASALRDQGEVPMEIAMMLQAPTAEQQEEDKARQEDGRRSLSMMPRIAHRQPTAPRLDNNMQEQGPESAMNTKAAGPFDEIDRAEMARDGHDHHGTADKAQAVSAHEAAAGQAALVGQGDVQGEQVTIDPGEAQFILTRVLNDNNNLTTRLNIALGKIDFRENVIKQYLQHLDAANSELANRDRLLKEATEEITTLKQTIRSMTADRQADTTTAEQVQAATQFKPVDPPPAPFIAAPVVEPLSTNGNPDETVVDDSTGADSVAAADNESVVVTDAPVLADAIPVDAIASRAKNSGDPDSDGVQREHQIVTADDIGSVASVLGSGAMDADNTTDKPTSD